MKAKNIVALPVQRKAPVALGPYLTRSYEKIINRKGSLVRRSLTLTAEQAGWVNKCAQMVQEATGLKSIVAARGVVIRALIMRDAKEHVL